MIELKGYRVTEKLKDRRKSIIYKGVRESDEKDVIIKWVVEGQGFWSQEVLKKELQVSDIVDSDGIIKIYSLEQNHDGYALILEDIGGCSLQDILKENKPDLKTFLKIAIQMTDVLARIHAKNVIHKDVNPSNFICNNTNNDWKVKITDFGISTLLSREEQSIVSLNKLEGTLAYISPEQTGRMNRSIDYRTDIYSLGATFYELLLGKPPFQASDAVGWVHHHIAVYPEPLSIKDKKIPDSLSDIVLKMLSKNAEDRYQSALGIKSDLEECLKQLEEKGTVGKFEIAGKDVSNHFQIPQKLYGRESEIKTLLNAFKIAAKEGTTEMLLVGGYSGVGKSSLVQEIHKPIVEQRGYFISGKYDQFKRNVPYSAIILALKSLVGQLITEDEDALAVWKDKLLNALGANGQVMIETIPEVELILGAQPPVQELGPTETQLRFNNTFLQFINVFADEGHPLVLFLDDLQWADAASLNLVKVLMEDPDIKHMLLICAYRDNEVDSHHPFVITVEEIRKGAAVIEELILQPLQLEHVTHLIADTCQTEETRVAPISKLVMEKTGGNPFFVNMFLKTVYQEGLIHFDMEQAQWDWKLAEIESKSGTDNVLDLMLNKVKQLSPEAQKVIRLGASISNRFELGTLSTICEESVVDTARHVREAVAQGYLIPLGDAQKLLVSLRDADKSEQIQERLKQASLRFMHDRVQNAAYSLIDEKERPAVHLKIGRLLLKTTGEDNFEENIFNIVEQLNLGSELITDGEEKLQLVKLNLDCGKRAKMAAAYGAAVKHLELNYKLLGEEGWDTHYDLSYDNLITWADCLYLNLEYDKSAAYLEDAIKRARNTLDICRVHEIRLLQYSIQGKYDEIIKVGCEALQLLGVEFPPVDDIDALNAAFPVLLEEYNQKMEGRQIADFYDLPMVSSPEHEMAETIIAFMIDPTFFVSPQFLGVLLMTGTNFIIDNGLSSWAPFIFGWTSVAFVAFTGDYNGGYELGSVTLKLNQQKITNPKTTCKILSLYAFFVVHLRHPLRDAIQYMDDAVQSGTLNGELLWTAYSMCVKGRVEFAYGANLKQVVETSQVCIDYCEKVSLLPIMRLTEFSQNAARALQGRTRSVYDFSTEDWSEEDAMKECTEWNFNLGPSVRNYYKVQNAVILGDYKQAREFFAVNEATLPFSAGLIHFYQTNFYTSIANLELYASDNEATRANSIEAVKKNIELFGEWSAGCPQNFLHQYLCLKASIAAIEGREAEAIDLYDQAIQAAQDNDFFHEEAVINELVARFWLGKGKKTIARAYLTEAYNLFRRWGATVKVNGMNERYPNMIYGGRIRHRDTGGTISTGNASQSLMGTTAMSGGIDLNSVLKVAHTMAGEMKLHRLLDKLMEAVIENAGAQTGILFLERGGELVATAERNQASGENTMHDNIPLTQFLKSETSKVAGSIVRYAARTMESILVSDATQDERYGKDPHVVQTSPKSILCSPIINQGKLTGVLYLENNLSVGAFTPNRLELLGVLSSQAAISIDNAALYANLEEKVEERTEELRSSKKEIDEIFSNVEQGLMTIHPNGSISSEYSRKVVEIFERDDLGGLKFENLFLMDREVQEKLRDFIEQLLTNAFMSIKLFDRANPVANYAYRMVNQEKHEVVKVLDFKFSRIFRSDSEGKETKEIQKVMVVINDKTQEFALKKELEQKAEEQAGKVEKLYQILQLQPSVFSNFISESATTLEQVHVNLKEVGDDVEKNKELLRIVFREVHTLKGNARALNLDSIGKTAHELEDVFEELKEKPENITEDLKEKTFKAIAMLKEEIQDGNSLFEKILNMQSALKGKSEDPMGEFEQVFRSIVNREAKEQGKLVKFEFQNELGQPLGETLSAKLRNPLSHIVRNSIVHGIEAGSERSKRNKPETGYMAVKLSERNGTLSIICEDDGAGLDTKKIREKAERLKLYSAEELDRMGDNEINGLIFSSGLSTKDAVSNSAGRGVGMDAVKEDLKALKAVIAIKSKPNKGTRFTIQIPR